MAPLSRLVECLVIVFASSARIISKSALSPDDIPCPVVAAIVRKGLVTPDSFGKVSQSSIISALLATGASQEMALFLSKAATYDASDVHQQKRVKVSQESDMYLNFFTMKAGDACVAGKSATLPNGAPCNANTGYQQHGYSTMVRDPRGGLDPQARFKFWFETQQVLSNIPGVSGRVLTVAGIGKLLKAARNMGDRSGEFSLNSTGGLSGSGMKYYHPSVTVAADYSALSQWEAVTALTSLWVAFAHEVGGVTYMSESDLRAFFIQGQFPADWKKKPWGFREMLSFTTQLEGMGVGDEWVRTIKGVLAKYAGELTEQNLLRGMTSSIVGHGGALDDISSPLPTFR